MIEIKETKNMLDEISSGYIVHGCNCQGRMGSGIAVAIREKYPSAYTVYRSQYINNGKKLQLGDIIEVPQNDNLIIVNAMTQDVYKGHHTLPNAHRYVDYEAVATAFELLNLSITEKNYEVRPTVHFPLIGAGLAKGNWDIIAAIIDNTLTDADKMLWVLPQHKEL